MQQRAPGVFKSPVHQRGVRLERRHIFGKYIRRHTFGGFRLADVVKFLQIGHFKAFGRFLSFADVAALAEKFFVFVFFLVFFRHGEKPLHRFVQFLSHFVGKAVIFDGHEANGVKGRTEVGHESGFHVRVTRGEVVQVERGDFI